MKLDDESLERALMALPLEEPPRDLRAAILAATVYRPPAMFSSGEIVAIGSLAAAILWLGIVIALDGATPLMHHVAILGSTIAGMFSNPSVLAWLAAGVATAFWLTLFTGSQPAYAHGRRAKRPAKT